MCRKCNVLGLLAGVGGQVDFIRGAALGFDGQGKPILAMPSVTKRGESKIVPTIKEGENEERVHEQFELNRHIINRYILYKLSHKSVYCD